MENLLIFITTAGVLMLFLSVTGLVVMILRQRRSTQHSKGKGNNTKKNSTSNYVKSPQLGFVLPTHVPKTVSYVNSSALRNPSEELNLDMIDPELYHTTRNERSESLPSLPGSLCFSVQYEKETEKLIVGIIRGQRLWPKSSNPTATPYVKICLLPDKRKKLQTKPRQKTPNPLFNEEFYFYCPFSELRQRCLRFTVCDFDRFSRQNVIGTVIFSLDDNFEKILSTEGCVEVWRDIEHYETESCNCFGEVLFSLQYLPTAKRLTIAILKGKSFGIQGNGKDPSIYVKITMICGGKATRSRKTTKKHDIDPIFNESFHFDTPDTLFDRTSFTLAVVNNKRLIGRVVVGPFLHATGTGLTHWNDMLNSPHNAVAMWHTLL